MKTLIGYGILAWSSSERRSNRYGCVFLFKSDFENRVLVENYHEVAEIRRLLGSRVRLTCEVVESRDSGHVGDRALDIKPSRPQVGEIVDLGVGILELETLDFQNDLPGIALQPDDDRSELWIDPRKLYRLHDQTVRMFAEETEDDFTPVARLEARTGVVALGDGSVQSKRVDLRDKKMMPKIERLGHGLFALHSPATFEDGEEIELL